MVRRMNDVKMHAMFSGLDWDRLEAKLIPAPWVPDEPAPSPEPETPNVNDVYTGDQVGKPVSCSLPNAVDFWMVKKNDTSQTAA